ncbi:hypothetical protein P171DRAFT_426174 [Karstenula rhodostoma CBS 690.94]|uniref:Uncharacterized protein n=1 Tax=Karstenula rhodostoma CBS 690.94 TaxID=1392251 RepID=A0A9P4PWE4_9PLEO|nr:hypothetical protein P171DRAFT_426174 [Karstenula rhodostoma CBS 690.94]
MAQYILASFRTPSGTTLCSFIVTAKATPPTSSAFPPPPRRTSFPLQLVLPNNPSPSAIRWPGSNQVRYKGRPLVQRQASPSGISKRR